MKKNNSTLSMGVGIIIISFVQWIIAFITPHEYLKTMSLFVFSVGVLCVLAGLVIQKLDVLIDKLTPNAMVELWQDVQTKIQLSDTRAERKKKIDSLERFKFRPEQFNQEYNSIWSDGIQDIKVDSATTATDE